MIFFRIALSLLGIDLRSSPSIKIHCEGVFIISQGSFSKQRNQLPVALKEKKRISFNSESKGRHKIWNAEFVVASLGTWPGAFLNYVNERQKIQGANLEQKQTFRCHVAQDQSVAIDKEENNTILQA